MDSSALGSNHFLSLPRPDIAVGPPPGIVDTTTLAAHDFDVDPRTGFMPPQAPLSRLPSAWDSWEYVLDDAIAQHLKLGDTPGLSESDQAKSELWRSHVRNLNVLPITDLKRSELMLRRAHHVLTWIMHFYIHSLPPDAPVVIPPPITLPLLQVSAQLQLPPILTYSDDVLYNCALKTPSPDNAPTLDNLCCQTLFTSTTDEAEFYLTSARIELKGVDALELMQMIMDEAFVGDNIALRRITSYLIRISAIIEELRTILLSVRDGCDPARFYNEVRPWFRGEDSDRAHRKWVFEGIELDPSLHEPTELSGPSAAQSSLIHALDIFLGVDRYSHSSSVTGSSSNLNGEAAFLDRMQLYMPRHHRRFLNHLSSAPRPLRELVIHAGDSTLLEAYNGALKALKEFRDAHMKVVALYIVGPSRRSAPLSGAEVGADVGKDYEIGGLEDGEHVRRLKGTGGTELVRFLKDVRERTANAILRPT